MANDNNIDISGINKSELLASLYNHSMLDAQMKMLLTTGVTPSKMEPEEAQLLIDQSCDEKYFDYIKGRVIKTSLAEDSVSPWGYDRDNGEGSFQAVVDELSPTVSISSLCPTDKNRDAAATMREEVRNRVIRETGMLSYADMTFPRL